MHPLLVEAIVKICRQREADGDCPTIAAASIENLENVIISLADENKRLKETLGLPS